jgi:hypothetical protein
LTGVVRLSFWLASQQPDTKSSEKTSAAAGGTIKAPGSV